MASSIASAFTGKAVNKDIAMTGEATLRGRVLPVGGLKEKTLAAKRMGIKKVIVPSRNKKDVVIFSWKRWMTYLSMPLKKQQEKPVRRKNASETFRYRGTQAP
jgi:predicted ATP-dependent protease